MLYQTPNPHGGDVYGQPLWLDFSANTNPFGTPPAVLAAVEGALGQLWQYPDPYCRELTAAIAAHEGVSRERILCGSGAAELIYSFCQALQPKRAAELAPTFAEYALALERTGCRVFRYQLSAENGFLLDGGILDFLSDCQPEVLFLCNPNNPTGRLMPPALLGKVLDFCREKSIRVFLDECFLDLTENGESLVPQLEKYPNLLVLKAFTKSYGMAGLRLGYCLSADGSLLEAMSRQTQPWNVSTPAQKAGVAALTQGEFLQRTVRTVAAERAWLTNELEAAGLTVIPGCANYLLFRAPNGLDTALRRQGIAIRSCANYYGLDAGWYRIAVRLRPENEALTEAIRRELGGL